MDNTNKRTTIRVNLMDNTNNYTSITTYTVTHNPPRLQLLRSTSYHPQGVYVKQAYINIHELSNTSQFLFLKNC